MRREEDVVVRPLDDVDRVDLHVAEMLDRRLRRLRAVAEGRRLVEPLGAEPDPPRLGRSQAHGFRDAPRHQSRQRADAGAWLRAAQVARARLSAM